MPPSWTALLALSAVVDAAKSTVEIDLVFPHNETYAPQPIFPVAFAVQNPEHANNMEPGIQFTITPYGKNSSDPVAQGFYDFSYGTLSGTDPVIQYGEGLNTLNTEGTWQLKWMLTYANCSGVSGRYHKYHDLVFTTKNGAPKPDLTAATTDSKMCSNGQASVFELLDTIDSDGNEHCPVLGDSVPSPTPCNVNINSSAASSVSASLTRLACAVKTDSWCPKPSDGAAPGTPIASTLAVGGLALLGAAFGGLGFVL